MAYTNSSLVSYTLLSPNNSGTRTHAIDRITPHCVVGQCSVETLGALFAQSSRQASCQYGIGADGRIGLYVPESKRSWCSSSNANDQRAVTIECASDTTAPYAFRDVVYQSLIKLCVDICKRNGKTKLIWFGDKAKTLAYTPASNEMILTVHRWFANKSCPGDWMYARMGDLASKVTAQLQGSTPATKYAVGWNEDDHGWWYSPDGNSYYNHEWQKIDGDWYYFGNDGYALQNTSWEYNDIVYTADDDCKVTWAEKPKEEEDDEMKTIVRYDLISDVPSYYRATLDKLIDRGILTGRGGSGEDMVLDMTEDAVRVLVILDRAGVFA